MKKFWKMIIAFALIACMALTFIACGSDDITYNGDSDNGGGAVSNGDGADGGQNETPDSGSQGDNENDDNDKKVIGAPSANTEGGWSQLYPAG